MTLAIAVATMQSREEGYDETWMPPLVRTFESCADRTYLRMLRCNTPEDNLGVVRSYQWMYERLPPHIEYVLHLHDDVECFEDNWTSRMLAEFEDPKVAIIGFGGALRHGSPNLYKVPYRLQDLARFGYLSNVKDADQHGERFTGSCDVAVLDGFALCIRRSFLDEIRGWSHLIENKIDYLNYDYWICALARRHGYRIRMVGISCAHYGGGTAVGVVPVDRTDEYEYAHRRFYEEFRDTMPARVRP